MGVHTGPLADIATNVLQARAFTVGRHIVLGRVPGGSTASANRHLMAHELTHVLQQKSGRVAIHRQEIPVELRISVNHREMTDPELQQRYDLIAQTLMLFDQSTAETALLEEEAGRIGTEVLRRQALASRRTFSPEAIQRMREFFSSPMPTQRILSTASHA